MFALALSADQLLLACISHEAVRLYSLPQLVHEQQQVPLHTVEGEVQQFAFTPSKAAADLSSFLSLSSERVLRCGSLLSGTTVVAENVGAACWSPDGAYIAYAQGNRVCVTAPDWKQPGFEAALLTEGESAATASTTARRVCCSCEVCKARACLLQAIAVQCAGCCDHTRHQLQRPVKLRVVCHYSQHDLRLITCTTPCSSHQQPTCRPCPTFLLPALLANS